MELYRRAIFDQLHQNEWIRGCIGKYEMEILKRQYRANNLVCGFCKKLSQDHNYYLDTTDHQLCDGDVVHL